MPRLSVNINDETSVAIKTLMEEEGLNATEIIRRAISAYAYIVYHQNRARQFVVLKPSGRQFEEVRFK
jgi:hypothetical protein